jgi:hypothetical protein
MTNKLVVLALALMLGACGDQGGQTAAPESAGSGAAAPAEATPAETTAAAPAAPAPAAEAPAAADEEVKYDPIDASKLDNSWYKQFGGGN